MSHLEKYGKSSLDYGRTAGREDFWAVMNYLQRATPSKVKLREERDFERFQATNSKELERCTQGLCTHLEKGYLARRT